MLDALVNHHSSNLSVHPKYLTCIALLKGTLKKKNTLKDNAYSFSFLRLLNSCLLLKTLTTSPKFDFPQSHCQVTYILRKERWSKNRLLFMSKKTRFLQTEKYLLVSKTAMDLCNLQFLHCCF